MYTDEILNDLNQKVYNVDPNYRKDITYTAKPDNELTGTEQNIVSVKTSDNVSKKYKIVASADIDNNGYQGFAVAPITKRIS